MRLIGSITLDALDKSWAAHLEQAASLHVDSAMVSRTGQKAARVYRSLLEQSFVQVFLRFEKVTAANLGGLRLNTIRNLASADCAPPPPGNPL